MSEKPMLVYVIRQGKDGQTFWNRAGVAFRNRDGSINFELDVLDRKFQIREQSEKK